MQIFHITDGKSHQSKLRLIFVGASQADPPYPVCGTRRVGGVLRGGRKGADAEAARGGPRRRRLRLPANGHGHHELFQVLLSFSQTVRLAHDFIMVFSHEISAGAWPLRRPITPTISAIIQNWPMHFGMYS